MNKREVKVVRKRRAKNLPLFKEHENNGGLPPPPLCYVCGQPTEVIPLVRKLEARRTLNCRQDIVSPGFSPRYPLGLCRHSVTCAPGTQRWKDNTPDKGWLERFAGSVEVDT